jgi:hypothetical protein
MKAEIKNFFSLFENILADQLSLPKFASDFKRGKIEFSLSEQIAETMSRKRVCNFFQMFSCQSILLFSNQTVYY